MRQQLRLRVLLPVAVLALLGAGVGAYATGGGGDTDASAYVVTHADKKPKKPGAVAAAVWVKRANAVCRDAAEQIRSVGKPKDAESGVVFLAKMRDVNAGFASALDELGWPRGKKTEVRRLSANARAAAAMLRQALSGTIDRSRFASRDKQLSDEWAALTRSLGLTSCITIDYDRNAFRADEARPAATRLEGALAVSRAAVVVLYTPEGGVDNTAVREARAGAVIGHAGFVAVNVTKNSAVAKLFEKYGVREAPAVLVFVRGPKLVSHFDGFADRGTVAQAVADALR